MSSGHDAYADIAEWYDHEHDPYVADVALVDRVLRARGIMRGHVLEVGSGTGRMLAGLAAAGHEVVGVEPSAAMRARAARRLAALPARVAQRVAQRPGEAAALAVDGETYDLVLYGLGTLAHVLSPAERVASLQTAHGLLRAGGVVLVDLDQAGLTQLLAARGHKRLIARWTAPGGERIAHYAQASRAPDADVITVRHTYEVSRAGGQPSVAHSEMRFVLLAELTLRAELAESGFRVESAWGDHSGAPYDADSPRLIVLSEPV